MVWHDVAVGGRARGVDLGWAVGVVKSEKGYQQARRRYGGRDDRRTRRWRIESENIMASI